MPQLPMTLDEAIKAFGDLAKMPLTAPLAIGQALIEGGQLIRDRGLGLPSDPFKATAEVIRRGLPGQLALKGGEIFGAPRTVHGKTGTRTTIF